ncbi:MAG: hypothetical protein ACRDD8_02895 [Bacteroidales bacterium]
MRQIEKDMLRAIKAKENFKKSNTSVYVMADGLSANVRLHGNLIATVFYKDDKPNAIQIFDGGWQSNTTKSRLNALLDRINVGVCQIHYRWFFKYTDGHTKGFENGMVFEL